MAARIGALTLAGNYLIVGCDSRYGMTHEQAGALHTGPHDPDLPERGSPDAILLLHQPPHGTSTVVSLPRDALTRSGSHGELPLRVAFSLGGPELLVDAVSALIGAPIHGYLEIGITGFCDIVEALDGIPLTLDAALGGENCLVNLPAGPTVLRGSDALGFVRERYTHRRGDLDRNANQRAFLVAVARRTLSAHVLLSPRRLGALVRAITGALTTDSSFGPFDAFTVARGLWGLAHNGCIQAAPVQHPRTSFPPGAVVMWRWKEPEATQLWERLR